jgi:hypothetical protein
VVVDVIDEIPFSGFETEYDFDFEGSPIENE